MLESGSKLNNSSYRLSQLNEIVRKLKLPMPPSQWDEEVDIGSESLPQALSRVYQVIEAVPSDDNWHPQRTPSEEDTKLVDQYCASITRTHTLRSHLQEVDEDLENYAQDFGDWCQIMVQITSGFSTSLIPVSTVGAGLVYSTIFGCDWPKQQSVRQEETLASCATASRSSAAVFSCPSSSRSSSNGGSGLQARLFLSISSLTKFTLGFEGYPTQWRTIVNCPTALLKSADPMVAATRSPGGRAKIPEGANRETLDAPAESRGRSSPPAQRHAALLKSADPTVATTRSPSS
ncbi:hypothetical protein B0H14DRAFT_2569669 [Mycena olivaceomarginata]|nr:hypothetical protein B0H14DRAFT_2569669 [Mycena olivaceomarginata]